MPNYLSHEYFGQLVQEHLPERLRVAVEKNPEEYRCGLYGPDPLLFTTGGLSHSRYLHGNWQSHTVPQLQSLLCGAAPDQSSFALGYLLHMVLDDACHPQIYRWMEEGLSHRNLEMAMDYLVLQEMGEARFFAARTEEPGQVCGVAAQVIGAHRRKRYRVGLARMGLVCRRMNGINRFYRNKLGQEYIEPVDTLMDTLYQSVDLAVPMVGLLLSEDLQLSEFSAQVGELALA